MAITATDDLADLLSLDGALILSVGSDHMAVVGPRHRPPLALRALAGLLGVAMLLVTAALMVSDRAPRLVRRVGGDLAQRISERIDADGRAARMASDPRIPESDALIHIGLWGVVVVLVGLAVWTWWGLVVAAAGVFAASVFVEVSQGAFADTRTVEVRDVIANGGGVALGTVAVAVCYLGWSALASTFSRDRAG